MHSVSNPVLQRMLQRGQLFSGPELATESAGIRHFPTGYEELDQWLGGGLQQGRLHEVQLAYPFCGESHLWRSAVADALQHHAPVFWINPPATVNLAGIARYSEESRSPVHIVLESLDDDELVWCAKQILHEVNYGVVLLWHRSPHSEWVRQWQRALQHGGLTVLVFCLYMDAAARAYHTRLRAVVERGLLRWDIVKRPGGWPVQSRLLPIRPSYPIGPYCSTECV